VKEDLRTIAPNTFTSLRHLLPQVPGLEDLGSYLNVLICLTVAVFLASL
jgi:hypothetical protein